MKPDFVSTRPSINQPAGQPADRPSVRATTPCPTYQYCDDFQPGVEINHSLFDRTTGKTSRTHTRNRWLMATSIHQASFERAIENFKKGLGRREMDDFRKTTFTELKETIATLQARQHFQRRLQDFNRLHSFLETIEQYGKVVTELFYRSDDIVAFVWVGDRSCI